MRRQIGLLVLLALAVLAVATYVFVVKPAADSSVSHGSAGDRSEPLASETGAAPKLPSRGKKAALDCQQPVGDVARVDDMTIPATRLCGWLAKTGGANPRLVLDRMIDASLVSRALVAASERVTDAEVDASLKEIGAGSDPLLREQARERLELAKLVKVRVGLEVTEADVDAELRAGAPGIDRGQGVKVDGWMLRVPPNADNAKKQVAAQAAKDFVAALSSEAPEDAAKQHRFTYLQPFVLGSSGLEPKLEATAHSLGKGQLSGAIETRVGWTVIRVIERVEGTKLDDKGLRERVRRALETRKLQAASKDIVTTLRNAARIEIFVEL